MNEYDEELNKYIESNPPETVKLDPIDQAMQQVDEEKEVSFKLSEKQAADSSPDEYAKYHKVSQKMKLPVEHVRRNWEMYKREDAKTDYAKLKEDSPHTAEFLTKPENMKLFKDDVSFLQGVEANAGGTAPDGAITETFEAMTTSFKQGTDSVGSGMLALGTAGGVFDPRNTAADIAKNERISQEITRNKPTFMKEFSGILEEEGNDVDQAWSMFTTGFSDIRKKGIMQGLAGIGEGGLRTVYESIDYLAEYVVNPRGTMVMIAQNLPNAIPSLGAFAYGLSVGGPVGGALGAFTAGSITETGAGILQGLRDAGIDLTDEKQVYKAFRNKELMERVREKAAIKGFTTGAIDAIFSKFAGVFFKGAGGSTLAKKAIAMGKDVTIQGVGEFASETGGQFTSEGFDFSKVRISEGLAEMATSTGQGIAETSIAASRNKVKKVKMNKDALTGLKETVQFGIAAIKQGEIFGSLEQMVLKVKESKSLERAPEVVRKYINKISPGSVYFQSDDWQTLFPDNALEKADELLPGGREQYLDSLESGTPMEVSKGAYVVDLAKEEGLETIVRSSIDGLTESENQQVMENLEDDMTEAVDQVKEQIKKEEVELKGFEAVQENVKTQLKEVGFDQDTAEAYAAAMEPIKVMAERSGIDPQKLYDRYNLKIRNGENIVEQEQAGVEQVEVEQGPEREYSELNDETKQLADELIETQISQMVSEIEQSEQGKRSGVNVAKEKDNDGAFENINTTSKSTFPEWFQKVKGGSKKVFFKAAAKKKGVLYERIKEEAIDRLVNGFENDKAGRNLPDNTFRALLNKPGINEDGSTQKDFGLFQNETKEYFQDGDDKKDPRGRILISPNRNISIDLFKNADKSTFLHEAGHLFLEIFGDLATDINADKGMMEDYNEILKGLGVNDRSEIKKIHHEKWAKMFEAYLATSEAPSAKLQSAFRKFRVFMAALYGKLLKNKVPLSPEIRGVMDRMFASQEEIQELMKDRFISSDDVSQYVDALGLNAKDTERLTMAHQEAQHLAEEALIQKEIKKLENIDKKKRNELESKILAEVIIEADKIPIYTSVAVVQDGGKFNTQELKSIIGEEKYKKIKDMKLTSPTGQPVEILAEIAGFNSAEQLIDDAIKYPPRDVFIRNNVQARLMQETETGQLLETRRMAAIDIVAEKTQQLKKLEFELMLKNSRPEIKKALIRLASKLPKDKQVKRMVERQLGKTALKNLKPYQFSRMENKHRKASIKAMLVGDFELAYSEKYKERLNNELYNQARKLELSFEKFENKTRKIFKTKEDKLVKSYELNYINLAKGVMNDFGIIPMSEGKEQLVNGFMKSLAAYDPSGFERVESVRDLLADIPVRDRKHLTLDEYTNIKETVEAIIEIARDEKNIDTLKGKMNRDDVLKEFLVRSSKVNKHKIVSGRELLDKAKIVFLDNEAGYTRVEHFINQLDDFDINGPLATALFGPIINGQTEYDSRTPENLKQVTNIIKTDFSPVFKNKKKINLSNYFDNQNNETITQQELLMVLLNTGNVSNLTKLVGGRGWGIVTEGVVDTAKFNEFLTDMVAQEMITEEIMDGVQSIWDMMEELKPEIQKVYKKTQGRFMGEILPDAFPIPGLKQRKGGYFPVKYDSLKVEAQGKRDNQQAFDMQNAAFTFAAVPRGATKSRVENYIKPISLEFGLIKSHFEETLRFITLAEAVHNANKIVKNTVFREQIQSITPKGASVIFDSWLARVSHQRTTTPPAPGSDAFFSNVALRLNQGAIIQIMGGNVYNSVEQITEVVKYIPEVGAKNFYNSTKKAGPELIKQVKELSPFMREHLENTERKVAEQSYDLGIARSKGAQVYKEVTGFGERHAFFLQRMVSFVTDPIMWNAAFNKALKKGLSDADAVRSADSVIRRIGGVKSPSTISDKEAGGAMRKLATAFTGFFINSMNQVKFAENRKSAYMYAVMLPSILGVILSKAWRDDFEEEEPAQELLDILIYSQVRYVLASRPLASQALRLAEGLSDDKYYNDRVRLSPVISLIEGGKGLVNFVKKDTPSKRDVVQSAAILGAGMKVPLAKPVKMISDLLD